MANIKSAKKRIKVNETKRANNVPVKSVMKTTIKKALVNPSEETLKEANKKIDKALNSGIITKNKAARQKSRIAKKLNNITHYYILDSKYSSSQTLEQYQVIDKLYDKYFTNLAVYDEDRNVLTTQNIISVNAIHPFGTYELSKWKEKSLSIIPDVSSILLSKEQNNLDYFIKLLNIR